MPVTDYYDYQDLFEECGCCGHFHRPEFRGDCRNNLERFSASDLEEQYARRVELDSELRAMGAVFIQTTDHDAAEAILDELECGYSTSWPGFRDAFLARLAMGVRS